MHSEPDTESGSFSSAIGFSAWLVPGYSTSSRYCTYVGSTILSSPHPTCFISPPALAKSPSNLTVSLLRIKLTCHFYAKLPTELVLYYNFKCAYCTALSGSQMDYECISPISYTGI